MLNRPNYYNDDLIEFCRLSREYDIKYTINLLIGLPGETREDFQETVDITRKCRPTFGVSVNVFFPYPGTKLFKVCQEQNLLSSEAQTTYFERTGTVLNLPGFSPWQVKKEYILFYYKVYKGYKPWTNIALETLRYTVDAFPPVKRFFSKIVHSIGVLLPKRSP